MSEDKKVMADEFLLEQFVPSSVCLSCEGCCRFKAADSPWRPRLGLSEKNALALRITGDFSDDQGYIKTIAECGNHLCQFFKSSDSTCQVYAHRPFECALYPFILSKGVEGIKVFVHLSCPYVQAQETSPTYEAYKGYLEGYFNRDEVRAFLKQNDALFHDYSVFAPELLHLFDLPEL